MNDTFSQLVGAVGFASLTVRAADTAVALGSGDVPVLGTPRVVALAEAACVAALLDRLNPEQTSVGTRVELEHLGASEIGANIRASASVTGSSGLKLIFEVEVHDGSRLIAQGFVTRAVVDRVSFMAKAAGQSRTE
ncbi:fluoroacetyl-CoA thioesterase [mine drainage metagenome]|uniref:Fluoroacetyl-CoA thioesterase n=1 Tax=mine drainage metagenome TaxID=410659 RepID=A0A1J5PUS2_9ZZZZ